jgi:thioredoxin 1
MAIIKLPRVYLLALTMILLCSFSGKENAEYKNLDARQYNKLVDDREQLVLVEFSAPWCRSCRLMAPHVDKIGQMYRGKVKIVRINVDENRQMSQVLNIKYLPTVYLYKNNQAVWSFTGYLDRYPLQVYVSRHLED